MKKHTVRTKMLNETTHTSIYYTCDACRIYFKAKSRIIKEQKNPGIFPF
ncbi:hypothetical protein Spiaf_0891 [Spirochaeta africana DSM 8902]|uniref:Uncharacterized protein n=1 Tax=Spirochaeta africana (strain ATCC 700263 / DSM 8902 / Z-7692) TaxID=889378 RepID=H9UHI7_SPIAZ|nr:hypothetical protein Spiaf_0891 [Spirochaeta africana DSM 8902]